MNMDKAMLKKIHLSIFNRGALQLLTRIKMILGQLKVNMTTK